MLQGSEYDLLNKQHVTFEIKLEHDVSVVGQLSEPGWIPLALYMPNCYSSTQHFDNGDVIE